MKHPIRRWGALLLSVLMLLSSFVSTAFASAETMTDEDWTKLAHTRHNLGCTATQGLAVGEKYLYSFMVGGENTKAIVFRVDKDTGRTTIMKNGDTGENYFTNLGHANDADAAVIDGVEYLFVLASGNGIETGNIIVFEVDGKELYQRAQYTLKYNGGNFNPGSFAFYKMEKEQITFAFKWSHKTVSLGKVRWGKEKVATNVSVLCYLDSTAVEVNGEERNFTGFANQGIDVCGDILFAVYAGCYEVETVYQSLILGFDLSEVEKGTTPTLEPREDLILYMESSDYPRAFEMEDCGISSDGKMYFNANCWKSVQDTNHGGVFVLNDFVMPGFEATETEPPVTEPPATEPPATEPPATEPPATEPPATEPSATEPPATEPPATEPPATEPPATEPPATEPPATEPPATEPPATEPPATEPPATELPVEDTPIVAIAAIAVAAVAVIAIVVIVLKKKKK